MHTLRYSIVLALLLGFLGVSSAEDLIQLSVDDANEIAQVVADTFTEYTGDEWVALSPVELRDDSTDELVGYFYLVTNDFEAGATTIEGLEAETVKAFNAFPSLARSYEQSIEFDHFGDNYFTLVVASEYTEYPIINFERCGFTGKLFSSIILQSLGHHIIDATPSNYRICRISYFEQYGDWNSTIRYIKYIVKSTSSGEELTILDGFAEVTMETYESFNTFYDISDSLSSIGLIRSHVIEIDESHDIIIPEDEWNINESFDRRVPCYYHGVHKDMCNYVAAASIVGYWNKLRDLHMNYYSQFDEHWFDEELLYQNGKLYRNQSPRFRKPAGP